MQQFLNVVHSLREFTVTANSETGVTVALDNSNLLSRKCLNVVLSLRELTVTAGSETGVTVALFNSKLISSNF